MQCLANQQSSIETYIRSHCRAMHSMLSSTCALCVYDIVVICISRGIFTALAAIILLLVLDCAMQL